MDCLSSTQHVQGAPMLTVRRVNVANIAGVSHACCADALSAACWAKEWNVTQHGIGLGPQVSWALARRR